MWSDRSASETPSETVSSRSATQSPISSTNDGSICCVTAKDPVAKVKWCHGGLLMGEDCKVTQGSWRRVCTPCLNSGTIELPADRCWLLQRTEGSTFSPGRTYYVQWSLQNRLMAESVRPFSLVGSNMMLLIFASASAARTRPSRGARRAEDRPYTRPTSPYP